MGSPYPGGSCSFPPLATLMESDRIITVKIDVCFCVSCTAHGEAGIKMALEMNESELPARKRVRQRGSG